jgi:predicted NACHT family NTPase
MASRSLTASESGIAAIQNKLTAKKLSHEKFAEKAEISKGTAIGFCTGKPVDRKNFVTCCEVLELDWEVVSGQKEALSQPVEAATDIDELVRQLRDASAASLRKRCGTMRILDMTQPIDSGAIYTDVNILKRVAAKTRREIQEMMADCGAEKFDRFFLGDVKQKRVEGLKAVLEQQQLMILGRPGAGKTTFLKRLAIVCLKGEFLGDQLPIFVALKEFAETINQPGLVNCMGGFVSPEYSQKHIQIILEAGRGLVLLDGLDEVMEKDHDRVIREIRDFAEKYDQNHILITCRIAAQEYILQQFTEVEMADFDDDQIQTFADKWFKAKENNPVSTTRKMFWQELKAHKPVKELAANPLLLTLLCLEFNDNHALPKSRFDLFERGTHCLLHDWDEQWDIKRDEVYKGLSLKRKELLLGQLAMYTFERGDYFFKERVATQQIEQYIRNLPGASEDAEALLVDSRAVLKSMESQHGLLAERATGIYSFSHLTFHEYFTAKNILDLSNPAVQEKALKQLVTHIGEKRWKEVFLLVVEGLDDADCLLKLIHQAIKKLLVNDEYLREYLNWIQEKSSTFYTSYKLASIRAFYYSIAASLPLTMSQVFDETLKVKLAGADPNNDREMELLELENPGDLDLDLDFALSLALNFNLKSLDVNCYPNLDNLLNQINDAKLKEKIRVLRSQLLSKTDDDAFHLWEDINDADFKSKLRQLMIKHRNIGHDWQFTDEQKAKLQEYYDANLLLAQCLNSECYLSRETREEIEATMLLPIASHRSKNGKSKTAPPKPPSKSRSKSPTNPSTHSESDTNSDPQKPASTIDRTAQTSKSPPSSPPHKYSAAPYPSTDRSQSTPPPTA